MIRKGISWHLEERYWLKRKISKNIFINKSAKVFLFSTNLLKLIKYLQIEKSSINYKQNSLSLISFFLKNYKAIDHLISQWSPLKNRGSS